MMRVRLDHHPLDLNPDTVSEAIAAGAAEATTRGRLVTQVMVDGQRWVVGTGGANGSARDVELFSQPRETVIAETACAATATLGTIDGRQRDAAALLQSDERTEGMRHLAEAITQWQDVRAAVSLIARARGVDAADLRLPLDDLTSGAEAIQRLAQHLQAMRSALQAQDAVTLADILLYEMPPVVSAWRAMLVLLSDPSVPVGSSVE